MAVKFLHAADIHLGSPLELQRTKSSNGAFENATRGALERVVQTAVEESVDFLAVSGDLYDQEARSIEANEFLVSQFGRLDAEGIPCYVIHGNHDPLYEGAERLDWPDNVHVFPADDVEAVEHRDGDRVVARLLGQSYGQQWESNNLYWHYTPDDQAVPNIGLLHTGLNPDGNRYAPCSPHDLTKKDIDYWALGHIHTPGRVDGAPAAYPGAPQGRYVGEVDVGGCYVVKLDANTEPELTFVPASPVAWKVLQVDVGEATTEDGEPLGSLSDLESYVVSEIQRYRDADYADLAPDSFDVPFADVDWQPDGIAVRVELTGRSDLHNQLDDEAIDWLADQVHERLPGGSPAVHVESIRDQTSPPLPDTETLRAEDETIDELHELVDDLRADDDARRALRDEVGELWEWTTPEEKEDVSPKRVALDDDRLDDLIERALHRATDRLAMERYDAD